MMKVYVREAIIVIVFLTICFIARQEIQAAEHFEECWDDNCEICFGSDCTEEEKIPLSDEDTVKNYMKIESIEGTYELRTEEDGDEFIEFFLYDTDGELTNLVSINRDYYNTRY